MTGLSLQLRYSTTPLRQAVAWFVPGAGPAEWLAELVRWGVPHLSLTLRVVPHSADDRTPRGVLVRCDARDRPVVSLSCPGYGLLAGRLYLPAEGELFPAVTERELEELLPAGVEHVFHPAAGLVAFERSQVLSVADLLAPPAPRGRAWDRGQPGLSFPRLTALAPAALPTLQDVLARGRGDIGESGGALGELEAAPDEPAGGLTSRVGRGLRGMIAGVAAWAAGAGGAAGSFRDRLRRWAEGVRARRNADLENERNKELRRLMHLLESDPDRGLRYALPMGGDAHRGRGTPGTRLTVRDVNFSLGRMGGGGVADFWDVPPDYHQQLVTRYRQLAEREQRLGRHRRAAYIYAELLGDHVSAAATLTAGRHWREAAVLYRQRLNRPRDAASCLEQGGLWQEAIALYVELRDYEKAGDLCRRIGQEDEARGHYRQAVAGLRLGVDLLGAARLLEDKLDVPDEALAELASGWPHSAQAVPCLRGVFRLLGRLGRHREAGERVGGLVRAELPPEVDTPLVEALAELAGGYPDRDVRARAADAALVRASRHLPAAPADEARRLLAAVRRLAPEDRLLGRDTERYRARHTPRRSALPARRRAPTLVARLTLPAGVEWSAAAFDHDTVYAAGWRANEVVLARCHGQKGTADVVQGGPWRVEPVWKHYAPLQVLVAELFRALRVYVYIPEAPLLPGGTFSTHADFDRGAVPVSQPPGIARGPLGAFADNQGGLFVLERQQGQLTLMGWGSGIIDLWTTRALPLPPPFFHLDGFPLTLPVPMHYWGDAIAVAFLDHLVVVPPEGEQELVRLGRPVVGLCGGDDGLAVAFDEGGQFLAAGGDRQSVAGVALGDGLASPRLAFTGEGDLVAAAEDGCEVYEVGDSGMLRLKAALSGPRPRPVAVMPLAKSNQFGLFLPDGVVEVYQVP